MTEDKTEQVLDGNSALRVSNLFLSFIALFVYFLVVKLSTRTRHLSVAESVAFPFETCSLNDLLMTLSNTLLFAVSRSLPFSFILSFSRAHTLQSSLSPALCA